jgi:hypothetical protein
MTDFNEAVNVGMGIRLRLNRDQAQGFDFLLVFGTKSTVTPDRMPISPRSSTRILHHGLGFVRQGTPSNNTADAPSGFDVPDLDATQSYREERTAPMFPIGDGSNATSCRLRWDCVARQGRRWGICPTRRTASRWTRVT